MENSTTKTEGVHQIVPENPVHKLSFNLHKTGGSSDSDSETGQETSTQPNPTQPSDSPLPTTTQSPSRTTKTPRRPRSTAQGLTTSPSASAVVPQGPSFGVRDGDLVPGLPSLPPGPSPPLRPRLRSNGDLVPGLPSLPPGPSPPLRLRSNGDTALSPSKEHSSPNNRSLGQSAGPGPEPRPAGTVAGVAAARSRREDVGSDSAHRTRTTRTLSHVLT
ncbi:WW domain-binding protein 11-like isoform X2 [Oncorhynchus kisutch]|nr:WW domain-binding protein 11-like isoform X2 [Oncorhynchus kisutch]